MEICVKHYIDEIDNRRAVINKKTVSKKQRISTNIDAEIRITKFPSEFKKNIFFTFDKRFFFILLLSVIMNIGGILLLKKFLPKEITSKTINKIQEQYAKLLLDDNLNTPAFNTSPELFDSKYKFDGQLITGLNKWMDSFTNNMLESIKDMPAFNEPLPEATSKETKLPSKEERIATRSSTPSERLASMENLEKEVNSVGLLGLISSNAKSVDYEYVEDLLEYASENSSQLAEVLSKLNSIEVPRYGSSGYLKKIRMRDDLSRMDRQRGGRTNADTDVERIIENIEPIESVETTEMKRNLNYEKVTTGNLNRLANLNTSSKTRSAQDVLSVVQSHTRALQDCYKQELAFLGLRD